MRPTFATQHQQYNPLMFEQRRFSQEEIFELVIRNALAYKEDNSVLRDEDCTAAFVDPSFYSPCLFDGGNKNEDEKEENDDNSAAADDDELLMTDAKIPFMDLDEEVKNALNIMNPLSFIQVNKTESSSSYCDHSSSPMDALLSISMMATRTAAAATKTATKAQRAEALRNSNSKKDNKNNNGAVVTKKKQEQREKQHNRRKTSPFVARHKNSASNNKNSMINKNHGIIMDPDIEMMTLLPPPPGDGAVVVVPTYSSKDVLCGRGGGGNNHIGNRIFRRLVDLNRSMYQTLGQKPHATSSNLRARLVESIVFAIRNKGGRFLKQSQRQMTMAAGDGAGGGGTCWEEIPFQEAYNKTLQALRDKREYTHAFRGTEKKGSGSTAATPTASAAASEFRTDTATQPPSPPPPPSVISISTTTNSTTPTATMSSFQFESLNSQEAGNVNCNASANDSNKAYSIPTKNVNHHDNVVMDEEIKEEKRPTADQRQHAAFAAQKQMPLSSHPAPAVSFGAALAVTTTPSSPCVRPADLKRASMAPADFSTVPSSTSLVFKCPTSSTL